MSDAVEDLQLLEANTLCYWKRKKMDTKYKGPCSSDDMDSFCADATEIRKKLEAKLMASPKPPTNAGPALISRSLSIKLPKKDPRLELNELIANFLNDTVRTKDADHVNALSVVHDKLPQADTVVQFHR